MTETIFVDIDPTESNSHSETISMTTNSHTHINTQTNTQINTQASLTTAALTQTATSQHTLGTSETMTQLINNTDSLTDTDLTLTSNHEHIDFLIAHQGGYLYAQPLLAPAAMQLESFEFRWLLNGEIIQDSAVSALKWPLDSGSYQLQLIASNQDTQLKSENKAIEFTEPFVQSSMAHVELNWFEGEVQGAVKTLPGDPQDLNYSWEITHLVTQKIVSRSNQAEINLSLTLPGIYEALVTMTNATEQQQQRILFEIADLTFDYNELTQSVHADTLIAQCFSCHMGSQFPTELLFTSQDTAENTQYLIDYLAQDSEHIQRLKQKPLGLMPHFGQKVITEQSQQSAWLRWVDQLQLQADHENWSQPIAVFTAQPQGNLVQVDASQSFDQDGDQLMYHWQYVVNGQWQSSQSDQPQALLAFLDYGEAVIYLTVSDQRGQYQQQSKQINLMPDEQDQVTQTIPEVEISTRIDQLTVYFEAVIDEDKKEQGLRYQWLIAGEYFTGPKAEFNLEQAGVINAQLTLTHLSGGVTVVQKDIEVANAAALVNVTPTADFSYILDTNQLRLDAGSASDVDGEIIAYDWLINGDALSGLIVNYEFLDAGSYEIELSVTDNQGGVNSLQKTVNIEGIPALNKAPQVYIVDYIKRGEFIVLNANNSFDADNDPLLFWWEMSTGEVFNGAEYYYRFTEDLVTATLYVSDGKTISQKVVQYSRNQDTDFTRDYELELLQASADIGAQSCSTGGGCHGWHGDTQINADSIEYLMDIEATLNQIGLQNYYDRLVGDKKHRGGKLTDDAADNFTNLIAKMQATESNSNNQPPKAEFVASVTGTTVKFDASSSYDSDLDDLTYLWDFGDAGQAMGQNSTHKFNKPGKYVIKLRVSDGGIYDEQHQLVEVF